MNGRDWGIFESFGLIGFFRPADHSCYIVEAHQACAPRWCGKTNPYEKALLDIFRSLTSNSKETNFPTSIGDDDENRIVFSGRCPTKREDRSAN
jgi:hypothetical protein